MNKIIDNKTFLKEIKLCEKLSKKNNGRCAWGKCQDCGVIPLLYKFSKSVIIEDPEKIQEIKKKHLSF
ncbi:MAG: hypothetical protein NT135_00755 [Candidatus Berkelbacteria bacterium]|nr:hypothetical protein [Candidatus Berkelbacteria bacterium]